ncbi:hypothetical protein EKH77_02810 [Streptomyces luteoverticillatus]|uniref:Uncharacterized protein n=1 Tax=Streptomyces luteoverticillatus TaxID=66425 RepID=A0A3S9PCX5_STRLT|nr:hypothetical protein [Streptomyces luteoverticillatus]AZQ70287.1 hypothetical protein EKH77_02810 [Streptomyces luteoverticillatus]
MSERDSLGVSISAREIYDQIVGLRDDVRGLTQTQTTTAAELADHENRLRAIERWRYAAPLAGVSALGAIVAEAIRVTGKA